MPGEFQLIGYLRLLAEQGVEYVIVGGVGARMQGAATTTQEIDIMPDPEPANLQRLARALSHLETEKKDSRATTYVPHDDAKVFTYFKQAALGQVRPGFYNLGVCYVNGRGTAKDLTEGLAWLILAKKHDVDPRAEDRIRLQLQETDPSKIPLAEKRAEQLQSELFPPEPAPLTLPAKK